MMARVVTWAATHWSPKITSRKGEWFTNWEKSKVTEAWTNSQDVGRPKKSGNKFSSQTETLFRFDYFSSVKSPTAIKSQFWYKKRPLPSVSPVPINRYQISLFIATGRPVPRTELQKSSKMRLLTTILLCHPAATPPKRTNRRVSFWSFAYSVANWATAGLLYNTVVVASMCVILQRPPPFGFKIARPIFICPLFCLIHR